MLPPMWSLDAPTALALGFGLVLCCLLPFSLYQEVPDWGIHVGQSGSPYVSLRTLIRAVRVAFSHYVSLAASPVLKARRLYPEPGGLPFPATRTLRQIFLMVFGYREDGCFIEIGGLGFCNGLADVGWSGHVVEAVADTCSACRMRHSGNHNVACHELFVCNKDGLNVEVSSLRAERERLAEGARLDCLRALTELSAASSGGATLEPSTIARGAAIAQCADTASSGTESTTRDYGCDDDTDTSESSSEGSSDVSEEGITPGAGGDDSATASNQTSSQYPAPAAVHQGDLGTSARGVAQSQRDACVGSSQGGNAGAGQSALRQQRAGEATAETDDDAVATQSRTECGTQADTTCGVSERRPQHQRHSLSVDASVQTDLAAGATSSSSNSSCGVGEATASETRDDSHATSSRRLLALSQLPHSLLDYGRVAARTVQSKVSTLWEALRHPSGRRHKSVKSVCLDTFLEEQGYRGGDIDVLAIGPTGYAWPILAGCDLLRWRPRVVLLRQGMPLLAGAEVASVIHMQSAVGEALEASSTACASGRQSAEAAEEALLTAGYDILVRDTSVTVWLREAASSGPTS